MELCTINLPFVVILVWYFIYYWRSFEAMLLLCSMAECALFLTNGLDLVSVSKLFLILWIYLWGIFRHSY